MQKVNICNLFIFHDSECRLSNVPIEKNYTRIIGLCIVFLDQHNDMPVSWSYPQHLVWFCEKKSFTSPFWVFVSFLFLWGIWAFRFRFSISVCFSTTSNLISLSYMMPVFSANLFGLFSQILQIPLVWIFAWQCGK